MLVTMCVSAHIQICWKIFLFSVPCRSWQIAPSPLWIFSAQDTVPFEALDSELIFEASVAQMSGRAVANYDAFAGMEVEFMPRLLQRLVVTRCHVAEQPNQH